MASLLDGRLGAALHPNRCVILLDRFQFSFLRKFRGRSRARRATSRKFYVHRLAVSAKWGNSRATCSLPRVLQRPVERARWPYHMRRLNAFSSYFAADVGETRTASGGGNNKANNVETHTPRPITYFGNPRRGRTRSAR